MSKNSRDNIIDNTVDISEAEDEKKRKQFRSMFIAFLITSPLVVLFYFSCTRSKKETPYSDQPINPVIEKRIDSIVSLAQHLSIINPDSCEMLLNYSLRYQDSMKSTQRKLNTYMELVELYQYRKPNNLKALYNLEKAMELFIAYPGHYATDPYLFIDIGNVFFQFHLYDQSIKFYDISFNIGKQNNLWHPQSLALENTGLVYQNQQQYHKAMQFFVLANQHIMDREDIMQAGCYNSIAKNLVFCNSLLYVKGIAVKSLSVLDIYYNKRLRTAESKKGVDYSIWHELKSEAHTNLGLYFNLLHRYDSSDYHFRQAANYACKSSSMELKANMFLNMAMYFSMDNLQASIHNADTAMQLVSQLHDLYLYKTFCDSLASTFGKRHIAKLETRYKLLAIQLNDSIKTKKASKAFVKSQRLISTVAPEQAIQDLNIKKMIQQETIKEKNMLIYGISAFLLIILIFLYAVYSRNRKLRDAHKAMVQQIKLSFKKDDALYKKTNIPAEVHDDLSLALEKLMLNEKPFLNPELTFYDLVAKLNTNQTYLSKVINDKYHCNFHQYINQFRINESCRMLADPANKDENIDAIIDGCGFSTRSTFYIAFKKQVGMNPSVYQRINLESSTTSDNKAV